MLVRASPGYYFARLFLLSTIAPLCLAFLVQIIFHIGLTTHAWWRERTVSTAGELNIARRKRESVKPFLLCCGFGASFFWVLVAIDGYGIFEIWTLPTIYSFHVAATSISIVAYTRFMYTLSTAITFKVSIARKTKDFMRKLLCGLVFGIPTTTMSLTVILARFAYPYSIIWVIWHIGLVLMCCIGLTIQIITYAGLSYTLNRVNKTLSEHALARKNKALSKIGRVMVLTTIIEVIVALTNLTGIAYAVKFPNDDAFAEFDPFDFSPFRYIECLLYFTIVVTIFYVSWTSFAKKRHTFRTKRTSYSSNKPVSASSLKMILPQDLPKNNRLVSLKIRRGRKEQSPAPYLRVHAPMVHIRQGSEYSADTEHLNDFMRRDTSPSREKSPRSEIRARSFPTREKSPRSDTAGERSPKFSSVKGVRSISLRQQVVVNRSRALNPEIFERKSTAGDSPIVVYHSAPQSSEEELSVEMSDTLDTTTTGTD